MKTSHYIKSLLYLLASLLLGILISAYIPYHLQALASQKPESIQKIETRQTPTWGEPSWANTN